MHADKTPQDSDILELVTVMVNIGLLNIQGDSKETTSENEMLPFFLI